MRQMQEAVATAMRRQAEEVAKSQEERLALADQARDRGDMSTAATLYLRLAGTRPATPTVETARERFIELRKSGEQKLVEIDALLATRNDQSAGTQGGADHYTQTIEKAFEEYFKLQTQFYTVQGVGTKIRSHVARQKRQPEFAAVLNEPEAKGLFELAKSLEAKGQLCCAYYVYQQAGEVAHAPSGRLAAERYEVLSQNPQVVAEAKACAEMQWCQTTYDRAVRTAPIDPKQARQLFKEIVERAPTDSPVWQAAREQLAAN